MHIGEQQPSYALMQIGVCSPTPSAQTVAGDIITVFPTTCRALQLHEWAHPSPCWTAKDCITHLCTLFLHWISIRQAHTRTGVSAKPAASITTKCPHLARRPARSPAAVAIIQTRDLSNDLAVRGPPRADVLSNESQSKAIEHVHLHGEHCSNSILMLTR
jgi:hypothetical protein